MATHFDPQRHHRRSIRLRGYDYTAVGIYYVTICSFQYQHVFGKVVDDEMILSDTGNIVKDCWLAAPEHFPGVSLDEWVIMPNHIHGIIVIGEVDAVQEQKKDDMLVWVTYANGDEESRTAQVRATHAIGDEESRTAQVRATHASPVPNSLTSPAPTGPNRRSIGAIVGSFKSAAAKRINEYRATPGAPVWQRNYYEHIIRDEADQVRIQLYITANLARWEQEAETIPMSMD